MSRISSFFTLLALVSMQSLAADGFSVAAAWTGATASKFGWRGSIVRYDIKDNKVVNVDTIHSMSEGVAHMPCISQDGKIVCFFRGKNSYVNGAVKEGSSAYITVMNKDGSNKRNIVEFTGSLASTSIYRSGYDRQIDWPAGDWIYYAGPKNAQVSRVNYKTGQVEKNLANYGADPWMRRWNMSADGKRAACTNGSWCSEFPNISGTRSTDCGGCNLTLCASGRFSSSFGVHPCGQKDIPIPDIIQPDSCEGRGMETSQHCHFSFADWDWKTGKVNKAMANCPHTMVKYNTVGCWLGIDSVGRGGEWIRWAANSDKWVLHHAGWGPSGAGDVAKYGSNQLIYNWADLTAIFTSKNPKNNTDITGDRSISRCTMAGDFWVQPPKDEYIGTHYETIYGTWLPLGTYPEGPLPAYVINSGSVAVESPQELVAMNNPQEFSIMRTDNGYMLHFATQATGTVTLFNAAGSRVFSARIDGHSIHIPATIHGAYILQLRTGSKTLINRRLMI